MPKTYKKWLICTRWFVENREESKSGRVRTNFKSNHLSLNFQICPLYTCDVVSDSFKNSTTSHIVSVLPVHIISLELELAIMIVTIKPSLCHGGNIKSVQVRSLVPYTSSIQNQNICELITYISNNPVRWKYSLKIWTCSSSVSRSVESVKLKGKKQFAQYQESSKELSIMYALLSKPMHLAWCQLQQPSQRMPFWFERTGLQRVFARGMLSSSKGSCCVRGITMTRIGMNISTES